MTSTLKLKLLEHLVRIHRYGLILHDRNRPYCYTCYRRRCRTVFPPVAESAARKEFAIAQARRCATVYLRLRGWKYRQCPLCTERYYSVYARDSLFYCIDDFKPRSFAGYMEVTYIRPERRSSPC